MAVTLSDIARYTGNSISSVSAALKNNNSTAKVSPNKREHILAVAKRMGYRPSHAAQVLKNGHTHVLGMVIGEIHTPFYGEMTSLLMEEAEQHGYNIQIYVTNWEHKRANEAIDLLLGGRCDGILYFEGNLNKAPFIIKNNIPTIALSNQIMGLAYIGEDYKSGFLDTAEYLVAKGIKNSVFIGDQVTNFSRPKLKAVKEAFAEYGLDLEFTECHNSQELVYNFGLKFKSLDNNPEVILTENDTLATALLKGLFDAGVKVPNEVSVIGYNDTDYSKYCSPSLTTIGFDKQAYVKTAIDLMIKMINKGELLMDEIMFPTFFKKRDSA